MMLLDTNVLSELMKTTPDPAVIQWLDAQPSFTLFISSVTKAEIELGVALLPKGKRKNALNDAAQAMFMEFDQRCLIFGCSESTRYAQIVAENSRSGRPITVEDAQIAAIALNYGYQLVTRNVRDFFSIKGINLLNPWQQD